MKAGRTKMFTKISKIIGGALVSNFSAILFIPLSPYLFWAGINLVPVTHRDPPETAAVAKHGPQIEGAVQITRVLMFLTLADYASILRANYSQWIMLYITDVFLVS
jgi:hypothetical protein